MSRTSSSKASLSASMMLIGASIIDCTLQNRTAFELNHNKDRKQELLNEGGAEFITFTYHRTAWES